jgi:tRNA(adenine34) deaminase
MTQDETYLLLAMEQARLASEAGEIPVGAIVVFENEVIGRGRNEVLASNDPTAHAEIVALRAAARTMNNYRLIGCELYTTLEPCSMCAGAIIHSRISRLVFGAADPKAGAAGSVVEVINHPRLNHQLQITSGVLGEDCGEMLRAFFRERRLP